MVSSEQGDPLREDVPALTVGGSALSPGKYSERCMYVCMYNTT